MKRFMMMALVAVFVLGTFGTAMAETEFSGKGSMQFLFEWSDNTDFADDDNEDDFVVGQRTRLFLDAAASENVKATLGFEIDTDWGRENGGDLGADEVNIETKRAMITFKYPGTDLTFLMGVQGFALPGAVAGSPVLDQDLSAMAVAYTFNDMVSATAFWARVADGDAAGSNLGAEDDEFDAVGLILPISADGFTLTPWFMYGMAGADAQDAYGAGVDAWWLGAALEVSAFDPFVILADLIYGHANIDDSDTDIKGWFFDAAVAYKMDMVTPMIAFLWSSGLDEDGDDINNLPTVDPSWGFTNLGTASGYAINQGTDSILTDSGVGIMAVGLVLADFSFVESLEHDFALVYYTGTADEDAGAGFDEEDSAIEVNFDTKYSLYEELAAYIELGYISIDLDGATDEEDAWKLAIGLTYSF